MVAPTGECNSTDGDTSCCKSGSDGDRNSHGCCNDVLDAEAVARAQNYASPLPTLCENESFLGDIEDLVLDPDFDVAGGENRRNKSFVVPRVSRRHQRKIEKRNKIQEQGETEVVQQQLQPAAESIIPGTQKIYLKTWGCSHNSSDSEYMAGQLAAYGYQICDDRHTADLWLLNSCTVKNPAEDHFRNEVKAAQAAGKYIVVAGCVPQGQPKAEYIQGVSVIGVQQIDRVVEVVEETLKGHSVRLFGKKKAEGRKMGGAALSLPKIRRNPLIEIIAINTGCLNQCTYCKTKHARGELGSYSPEEIVARARQSFEEGVVEIWLTSEDLGAYGRDIGVTLPELLWKLAEVIPDRCMMRLGMTNPPYIMEHLEEIAQLLNHDRIYSFLHVPVQSGSDSVLMDMRREYCQADFRQVVEVLRVRVPEVTIATDVICGFPTETNEDFDDTLQLVRDYKFPSLFINQFFPRPGTPAAKMTKIPAKEVKRRTRLISDLFASYRTYDNKVGRVERVLVTELSTDGNYYVGHNKAYDQVLVPMDRDYMGKMIDVRITSAGKHYMMCEVLSSDSLVQATSDSFTAADSNSFAPASVSTKRFTLPSADCFVPVDTDSLASVVRPKSSAASSNDSRPPLCNDISSSVPNNSSASNNQMVSLSVMAAIESVSIESAAVSTEVAEATNANESKNTSAAENVAAEAVATNETKNMNRIPARTVSFESATATEQDGKEKRSTDGANNDLGDRMLRATFYVLLSALALRLTWHYFKRRQ